MTDRTDAVTELSDGTRVLSSRRTLLAATGMAGLLALVQSQRCSAAAQEASPAAPAAPVGPIKLVILYAVPDDPAAFDDYYLNTHLPKARLIPGYTRLELARVVATPDGGASPYHRVTEMLFPDMATFQASLASPEAQTALADAATFTPAGTVTLIAEIDVLEESGMVATPES